MLPPTKLYFANPVHLAAGAGSPAGSRGAKSKLAETDIGLSLPLIISFLQFPVPAEATRPIAAFNATPLVGALTYQGTSLAPGFSLVHAACAGQGPLARASESG